MLLRIRSLAVLAAAVVCALVHEASAQVIRDGTLGPGRAVQPSGPNYLITPGMGLQRGPNLFDSFATFSLSQNTPAGPESAHFLTAPGVENILARVTGGQESDIDGKLGADANLYLLNSSGIVFGKNATLDVKGSFHATTADYLKFSNGEVFGAHAGGAVPLLKVAQPEAFGFLSASSAAVSVTGSTLATSPGQSLSLVGGEVDADGARITAPGGTIHLAAVASPGEVPVVVPLGSTGATKPGGPVTLSSSTIDASDQQGGRGGGVSIEGGVLQIDSTTVHADSYGSEAGSGVSARASDSVTLLGGSTITSDSDGTATSPGVRIQAPSVEIKDGSAVQGDTLGPGNAGGVDVAARNLAIVGGGEITSDTHASGQAGAVTVTADALTMDGSGALPGTPGISSDAFPGSTGDGGTVSVHAGSLSIENGSVIDASTYMSGHGGAVIVKADQVTLDGGGGGVLTGLFSQANSTGNAGMISVQAGSLTVENGGQINASTLSSGTISSGHGGTIIVKADRVTVEGVGAFPSDIVSATTGTGNAGMISVQAGSLTVENGGLIDTFSSGGGDAGLLSVQTGSLTVENGSSLSAASSATGQAGKVTIDATGLIHLAGGYVDAINSGDPTKVAGQIAIRADTVLMDNEGQINTTSVGGAGTITVEASHAVEISNKGGGEFNLARDLFLGTFPVTGVYAVAIGTTSLPGGSIMIHAPTISIEDGGVVASAALNPLPSAVGLGVAAAGDLVLDAAQVNILSGGLVDSSTASRGPAGSTVIQATNSITIAGQGSDGSPSRVRAISLARGRTGNVTLDAPFVRIDGGAVATSSLDLFHKGGAPGGSIAINTDGLTVTGGGGIDASSFSEQPGGSIEINAQGMVSIQDPGSLIITKAAGSGAGGSIEVNARMVRVESGGEITAESTPGFGIELAIFRDLVSDNLVRSINNPGQIATGDAGSVLVHASDSVRLNAGSIRANAPNANGGEVTITANSLVDLFHSQVTADVGSGTGGNILIEPPFVVLDHSTIEATAGAGRGGHITINAENLFESPDSQITASAGNPSLSGTVTINAAETNIAGNLQTLPANFLDASAVIRERCTVRRHEGSGSFVVTSRSGAPASPDNALASPTSEVADSAAQDTSDSNTDVQIAAIPAGSADSHEPVGWLSGCAHSD